MKKFSLFLSLIFFLGACTPNSSSQASVATKEQRVKEDCNQSECNCLGDCACSSECPCACN